MAWYRCGGGEIKEGGSVILAPNPTITLTETDDTGVKITWAKPNSEVEIDHYNVYELSDKTPSTLNDFSAPIATTTSTSATFD